MTRTDGAGMAERLVDLCAELGADELRVLLLVAERLRAGRRRYGTLHVDSDQSRRLLETAGYCVTRAAGSLGAWDLVGIGPTDVVLCQVKSNRGPAPAEREALKLFPCPSNCKRLLHVWRDRQRWPEVREL